MDGHLKFDIRNSKLIHEAKQGVNFYHIKGWDSQFNKFYLIMNCLLVTHTAETKFSTIFNPHST